MRLFFLIATAALLVTNAEDVIAQEEEQITTELNKASDRNGTIFIIDSPLPSKVTEIEEPLEVTTPTELTIENSTNSADGESPEVSSQSQEPSVENSTDIEVENTSDTTTEVENTTDTDNTTELENTNDTDTSTNTEVENTSDTDTSTTAEADTNYTAVEAENNINVSDNEETSEVTSATENIINHVKKDLSVTENSEAIDSNNASVSSNTLPSNADENPVLEKGGNNETNDTTEPLNVLKYKTGQLVLTYNSQTVAENPIKKKRVGSSHIDPLKMIVISRTRPDSSEDNIGNSNFIVVYNNVTNMSKIYNSTHFDEHEIPVLVVKDFGTGSGNNTKFIGTSHIDPDKKIQLGRTSNDSKSGQEGHTISNATTDTIQAATTINAATEGIQAALDTQPDSKPTVEGQTISNVTADTVQATINAATEGFHTASTVNSTTEGILAAADTQPDSKPIVEGLTTNTTTDVLQAVEVDAVLKGNLNERKGVVDDPEVLFVADEVIEDKSAEITTTTETQKPSEINQSFLLKNILQQGPIPGSKPSKKRQRANDHNKASVNIEVKSKPNGRMVFQIPINVYVNINKRKAVTNQVEDPVTSQLKDPIKPKSISTDAEIAKKIRELLKQQKDSVITKTTPPPVRPEPGRLTMTIS